MIRLKQCDKRQSLGERELFLAEIVKRLPEKHVLLSTCNRVELYYDDQKGGMDTTDPHILNHLFRVVSGLESSLVGESQIQAQVKEAYASSVRSGSISKELHLLFQRALRAGKRVRSETHISRGAASHGQVAFNIIRHYQKDLASAQITILGVNHLNQALVRYLVRHGARTIFIGNRTMEKAKRLAQQCGGEIFCMDQLSAVLASTDILISATSAPHLLVHYDSFPKDRAMLVLDMAAPRDIEESIGTLPKVTLYNIEMIERTAVQNIEKRRGIVAKAETIIAEETADFYSALKVA